MTYSLRYRPDFNRYTPISYLSHYFPYLMMSNIVLDGGRRIICVLEDDMLYGLKDKGGHEYVGFHRTFEEGEDLEDLDAWEGVLDYDFVTEDKGEGLVALVLLVLAKGDRQDFLRSLDQISYVSKRPDK